MKKTLKLYEKQAYGRILICCENEKDQHNIKVLTGKKTLSSVDIEALEDLGIVIELSKVKDKPCLK